MVAIGRFDKQLLHLVEAYRNLTLEHAPGDAKEIVTLLTRSVLAHGS